MMNYVVLDIRDLQLWPDPKGSSRSFGLPDTLNNPIPVSDEIECPLVQGAKMIENSN